MEKIKFQIEIDRVLDVLSKEIYDSPYALLRENVQNAYDAILMRDQYTEGKWSSMKEGVVTVTIKDLIIEITDNGIGMSEKVLRNNYWKAGSTGKDTELAAKAGVIGTFGIGGMANFGICTKLRIETESLEEGSRIISEVERKDLSLTEDCITIDKTDPKGDYGTTITTWVDPKSQLTKENAQEYLSSFVRYLPVRVELNGEIISQKSLEEEYVEKAPYINRKWPELEHKGIRANVSVQSDYNGRTTIIMKDVYLGDERLKGIICLKEDSGPLWGYRSYFGLAPIPISSIYSFGGVINISPLKPTAGREALSKESINLSSRLIQLAEYCATKALAESEVSNRSNSFMSYVLKNRDLALAEKLRIRVEPNQDLSLGEIKDLSRRNMIYLYEGSDDTIIKSFGTPDKLLVVLSRSYPRRTLESQYLKKFSTLEVVKDTPKVLQVFDESSYNMAELSFVLYATNILTEDYLLQNAIVKFADLTHNLPLIARHEEDCVKIFIQKDHITIIPVLKFHSDGRDIFPGFIKDYIRAYIYPQVKSWVPSSTREGADAIQKLLRKQRELYRIVVEDVGLTSAFSDFIAGRVSFETVSNRFIAAKNTQTLEIVDQNVGNIENEIPDLVQSPVIPPSVALPEFNPLPAILRTDILTEKKLLVTARENPSLNNFTMFLAISDRAFREEYPFFVDPHTTRIIWGGRRIIFIFTHPSTVFSLYYDIELFEDIGGEAGGGVFPTTTIITKRRIFIPIPSNLRQFFELKGRDKREFYVRFDII